MYRFYQFFLIYLQWMRSNAGGNGKGSGCISTYTPLAGCDTDPGRTGGRAGCISTHTPLAGCDRNILY